jgi:undecaprenyl-diphosphatase
VKNRSSLLRYLWLAAAPILFWSAGRRGRRAALRGVVSSAIVAAILEAVRRVTGAERGPDPLVGAASAFATGASLELPAAAASAAGMIPALAGRSFARSVLSAGAGSAVALATTRVWRVPPPEGADAPKVWLPVHAEPSADGRGLTIVVNPASGSDPADAIVDELEDGLPKAKIVEIGEGDDLEKALADAVQDATALGIAGGDGSINTAAQVAMDARKPLMVVPSGTFNHLTGALGIENVAEAIEAVKVGECVGIDVATIDGKVFLNTASFGSYVEFVDAREKLEGRIGKWAAVVVALIRVLRHSDPVRVEIDGSSREPWLIFIGNCRYRPSGFAPSWRERFDDEILDVRMVDGTQPWARTRLIAAVLTGRLGRSRVYRQALVKQLNVRSHEGPLRVARDGEPFESSEEIEVSKLEERLAVYVPHTKR